MKAVRLPRNIVVGSALLLLSAFAVVYGAQRGAPEGGAASNVAQPADYRPVAPTPLKVTLIRDGVYWTQGGVGSNTSIIVGTDGVILFDPKETIDSAKEVLAEVAKITPNPVTHVIASHSNPDHVKGLPGYPAGTITIMHPEAAKELEMATWFMRDGKTFPRSALPMFTVSKKAELNVHGIRMILLHFAAAHTRGDLVGYLPDKKIVFLGDVQGGSPHLENDGTSQGMIESLKGILALDADTFVGGHSAPTTRAALQKNLDEAIAKRAKIVQLFNEGKPLDEAEKIMGERVVPRPTGPVPAGMEHFRSFRNMNYTENVYTELAWAKAQGK